MLKAFEIKQDLNSYFSLHYENALANDFYYENALDNDFYYENALDNDFYYENALDNDFYYENALDNDFYYENALEIIFTMKMHSSSDHILLCFIRIIPDFFSTDLSGLNSEFYFS